MLNARRLGLMSQPGSNLPRPGWIWAADNGCFSESWREKIWRDWLMREMPRSGCLFAAVPDVVGDHDSTLDRFFRYGDTVREARYPVAFVGQDGAEPTNVPWEWLDCLFVGGTTEWKLSPAAFLLAREARERGKWVHVGRVNSLRRFQTWAHAADSADGTQLAYRPSQYAPVVADWMDRHWASPTLF